MALEVAGSNPVSHPNFTVVQRGRASSITPPPTEAVEPPKRVTAVLVALTLGHLRVAEEQRLERAREAQHCLNQVRSGRE